MLYPLKLQPVFQERIWGGQALNTYFPNCLPSSKIGEVWVAADHPKGTSLITNGIFAGKSLHSIVRNYSEELFGYSKNLEQFPLLIKLIDAHKSLSVQVHPDDVYASSNEFEPGKAELWYILSAKPDSEIIYGLKPGITLSKLKESIDQHCFESCVNRVKVKPGEVLYIPPGLVHALGKNIIVAEVQTTSDLTYRIYDYNRHDTNGNPRTLHLAKAFDVIQCKLKPEPVNLNDPFKCPYFSVELISAEAHKSPVLSQNTMSILLALCGSCKVITEDTLIDLNQGEAVVLPACQQEFTLSGECTILRSSVPPNPTFG